MHDITIYLDTKTKRVNRTEPPGLESQFPVIDGLIFIPTVQDLNKGGAVQSVGFSWEVERPHGNSD